MSGFGAQCRKRLEELRKAGQDVPNIIAEVAEIATIAAVEKAVTSTPPNGGAKIAGTNMRTGALAQAWVTDSVTKPMGMALSGGGTAVTILGNNLQYASYVNDGHRMDKHFVPGLIINAGMLERSAAGDDGGIVVGTKTTYVPGLYIKEKAIGKYKTTVRTMLNQKVRELLK